MTVWREAEGRPKASMVVQQTPPAAPIRTPNRFRNSVNLVISLLPTKRRPQHSNPVDEMDEEIKKFEKSISYKLPQEVVHHLAIEALKRAGEALPTTDTDLARLAKRLFSSTEELDDATRYMIKKKPNFGVDVFIAAWKETWKHSWTKAWLGVWNSVAEDARRSGIEDEGPPKYDPTINDAIPAAYRTICDMLSPGNSHMVQASEPCGVDASSPQTPPICSSYFASTQTDLAYALQQARLIFKELDRLDRLLFRLMPTPHQDIMKINSSFTRLVRKYY